MKNLFFKLLLFCAICVFGQSGKVVKIKDGDTVVILDTDFKQHTIRVADIDCPEKGQPFGKAAKQFTSNEIFGKEVVIDVKNTDKYGRTVGYILYDTKNLSLELLKKGLAWHYKYYSNDISMSKLENEAKKNKIGLWAGMNPVNPHDWRKGNQSKK